MKYGTARIDLLDSADLVVDAVYGDKPIGVGKSNEVIHRLLPGISNSGGFRRASKKARGRVVILYSSGRHPDWPDELDPYRGTYTYFGDNRTPGKELHSTSRSGNQTLREAFNLASGNAEDRVNCPIFLVFEKAFEKGYDVKFLGLAVPGSPEQKARSEDLVAIWKATSGIRFQNYRAIFTILDIGKIDGAWIRGVISGEAQVHDDPRTPRALTDWVQNGTYRPLVSQAVGTARSRESQLPATPIGKNIISEIRSFCEGDDHLFEPVAAEIWRMALSAPMDYELTQRSRDGGRDAIGRVFMGPTADRIALSFSLEAKNYASKNGVGVKEISRLVSRIRHREFGVLVTTSYVSEQAYEEIRGDQHPIIVFSGADIVETLQRNQITTALSVRNWLRTIVDPR